MKDLEDMALYTLHYRPVLHKELGDARPPVKAYNQARERFRAVGPQPFMFFGLRYWPATEVKP